jgi:serine/threonine protein kinase HipA of HipAB toxin-antitoxin module
MLGLVARERFVDQAFDGRPVLQPRAIRGKARVLRPLREDRYVGDPVLAVFENLLPDNADIRRRLADRAKAEGSDPYSLLSAVGRDCIGALQFLPDRMAAGQP